MLSVFAFRDTWLTEETPTDDAALQDAAWIDLLNPDEVERRRVESVYRQHLPAPQEVEEIEATARFFEDSDGLHLHSYFLHQMDGRYRNSTVAFILSGDRLVTLHDFDLPAFAMFRRRIGRERGLVSDAVSIVLALLETEVDELADLLEEVYRGLERLSALVLEENDIAFEDVIDELARYEDLNGKVRLCLMDTQRALNYLVRRGRPQRDQIQRPREILRDINSLLSHSAFLFEKVNFLMDAAQGFINIEQNQIIKTFSIAAVVFLPPTLIASIYGMNFHVMPELRWPWGYPLALIVMVLTGMAPYWYFKRKGWL